MNLALLDPDHPQFPDPSTALSEPDGLLAVGGNLDPSTLVDAYRQGIFPW
ncbi:MAG: leucyl/phenylalanyl-tRNA--protein transferase, partial [Porticoccaceae bacterium]|nr:leucyl/phenylalanyl-tRNA--protein transferase [Porticoccaceae bacterium]